MAGIPRDTLMSTLALVGIGFAVVIGLLIFAFSILGRQGDISTPGGDTTPTRNFPTPTPEFFPNEPDQDNHGSHWDGH